MLEYKNISLAEVQAHISEKLYFLSLILSLPSLLLMHIIKHLEKRQIHPKGQNQ